MTRIRLLIALLALACAADAAYAQRIGIGIGIGVPYYRPYGYYGYYRPYGYYYPPPPAVIYATPPPVYVQPAPVVVGAPPAAAPGPTNTAPPSETLPTPRPAVAPSVTAPAVVQANNTGGSRMDQFLAQLGAAQEFARRDAALELGRMKVQKAVDPLVGVLANDSSPVVRDAAARALGLIAAPRSLNALILAAQADADRDVRHSAQFSVEIIRANLR